jgi:hypothetical protein
VCLLACSISLTLGATPLSCTVDPDPADALPRTETCRAPLDLTRPVLCVRARVCVSLCCLLILPFLPWLAARLVSYFQRGARNPGAGNGKAHPSAQDASDFVFVI